MPDLAWPTENDKTIKEIPLKQTVEIPTPLQGDLYEFFRVYLKTGNMTNSEGFFAC